MSLSSSCTPPTRCWKHTTSDTLKEHRSRERRKLFTSGLHSRTHRVAARATGKVPRSGAAECGSAMYLRVRRYNKRQDPVNAGQTSVSVCALGSLGVHPLHRVPAVSPTARAPSFGSGAASPGRRARCPRREARIAAAPRAGDGAQTYGSYFTTNMSRRAVSTTLAEHTISVLLGAAGFR